MKKINFHRSGFHIRAGLKDKFGSPPDFSPRVEKIERDVAKIERDVEKIEKNVAKIETDMSDVRQRLTRVETRLDNMDGRLEQMSTGFHKDINNLTLRLVAFGTSLVMATYFVATHVK